MNTGSKYKTTSNPAHLHLFTKLNCEPPAFEKELGCGFEKAGLMLLTWYCCAQLLLILLHPFTYSRGLSCLLPGVTLVVEHNVGAHAALSRLVQDWALHGKKCIHAAIFLLEKGRDVICCAVV